MRVTTNSVDEFLECLENEQKIFGDTIRVSINRNPLDGTKLNSTKFSVTIHASAVVVTNDAEYLLEVGQFTGKDYEDASQEKMGSEIARSFKSTIVEFANKKNWKVLPGVISE